MNNDSESLVEAERDHWLRLDTWTTHQGLALISKAQPDPHPSRLKRPLRPLACFAKTLNEHQVTETYSEVEAVWASGKHEKIPMPPTYYVEWAKSKGFDVAWLERPEVQQPVTTHTPSPLSVDVAHNTIPEHELHPNERKSYLIVIAALLAELDFNDLRQHGLTQTITTLIHGHGYKISDDTVRRMLEKVSQFIEDRKP